MLEQKIAQANAWIDELAPQLWQLSDAIYDHPEVGPNEVYASGLLTDYLEQQGFTVTRGLATLPTAFKAVWKNGEGGPNFGLLCEYDALAGMDMAAAIKCRDRPFWALLRPLKRQPGIDPLP